MAHRRINRIIKTIIMVAAVAVVFIIQGCEPPTVTNRDKYDISLDGNSTVGQIDTANSVSSSNSSSVSSSVSNDSTDPADPTKPADLADPANSNDPIYPTDPTNPSNPANPTNSTATADPAGSDDENTSNINEPQYILDELPDDVYSFAASLDGVVYSLPAPYAIFEQNGWTTTNIDLNATQIAANSTELVEMVNGGHTIYMGFINNAEIEAALADCYIGLLHIRATDGESGTNLSLPGGVAIGAGYGDVTAAYGIESKKLDYGWSINLQYKEQNSMLELELDVATLQVISINYRNYARRERLPEYVGAPPGIIGSYVTPETSDNDVKWQSLICEYGGSLYRLPVPAAELIKNGWAFITDENYMLEPGEGGNQVELRKENQTLYTSMINLADTPQPLKYCFLTELTYDLHNTKIHLGLPGGVNETSTIEEIIEAYGEPDYIEDGGPMFAYYTYGTDEYGINIIQSIESSQIVELTLYIEPAV